MFRGCAIGKTWSVAATCNWSTKYARQLVDDVIELGIVELQSRERCDMLDLIFS
jgi:hypothetical protein